MNAESKYKLVQSMALKYSKECVDNFRMANITLKNKFSILANV